MWLLRPRLGSLPRFQTSAAVCANRFASRYQPVSQRVGHASPSQHSASIFSRSVLAPQMNDPVSLAPRFGQRSSFRGNRRGVQVRLRNSRYAKKTLLQSLVSQLQKERNRLEDELHRVTAALTAFGKFYLRGGNLARKRELFLLRDTRELQPRRGHAGQKSGQLRSEARSTASKGMSANAAR